MLAKEANSVQVVAFVQHLHKGKGRTKREKLFVNYAALSCSTEVVQLFPVLSGTLLETFVFNLAEEVQKYYFPANRTSQNDRLEERALWSGGVTGVMQ